MSDKAPGPRQAVALSYPGTGAPRVVAKGSGEVAGRIEAIAAEHDVPACENPELVRLLARVDLGEEIPEALFVAVAEVIAFAWELSGKLPHATDPDRAAR